MAVTAAQVVAESPEPVVVGSAEPVVANSAEPAPVALLALQLVAAGLLAAPE